MAKFQPSTRPPCLLIRCRIRSGERGHVFAAIRSVFNTDSFTFQRRIRESIATVTIRWHPVVFSDLAGVDVLSQLNDHVESLLKKSGAKDFYLDALDWS